MDDVIEILDNALKKRGLSDAAASQLAVGNPSAIKNLRLQRGKNKRYYYNTLKALADVLGLEIYFGPPRTVVPIADDLLAEFAMIERIDVELAAGAGAEGGRTDRLPPMTFRRSWLASKGLKPASCAVFSVRGDSMNPSLKDGDLVLIDRTAANRDIKSEHIYAIVDESGAPRVKRLHKYIDNIVLRSDNPSYDLEVLDEEQSNRIQIIGKVVWSGHTWDV